MNAQCKCLKGCGLHFLVLCAALIMRERVGASDSQEFWFGGGLERGREAAVLERLTVRRRRRRRRKVEKRRSCWVEPLFKRAGEGARERCFVMWGLREWRKGLWVPFPSPRVWASQHDL